MLTRQQVVYGLERVELRSTDLFIECPFHTTVNAEGRQRPDPQCKGLDLLYRSADGSCNNLNNPSWGSSFMPFLRFLPPDYSDGVQAFRRARSGRPLPNPRLISSTIHKTSPADTQQFTMLVMQWGQFIGTKTLFENYGKKSNFSCSRSRCDFHTANPRFQSQSHQVLQSPRLLFEQRFIASRLPTHSHTFQ